MRWIVGLNSLRFYAIVLVVVYHLFRQFLPGGFIAVEIFFTLSGFLAVSKLVEGYHDEGKIHYGRFVWGRFRRLFLPLLICVVFTLTLALLVNKDILAGIQMHTLSALTFTTNISELISGGSYENTISPNLFEHTWFLALEMQFFLMAPLFAKLVLGIFRNRRRSIKYLGYAFLILGIVSEILIICYGGFFGAADRSYFALDTHMGAFCLGAAFAAFNFLVPRTPRTPKLIPTIGIALSLSIITILAFKVSYADPITFIFALPFVGLLSVIMIFCITKLQNNHHSKRIAPLPVRLLEYLGNLSFGIYLFHYPLFVLLPNIISPSAPAWVAPVVNIVVSALLAWFFVGIFDFGRFLASLPKRNVGQQLLCCALLLFLIIPAIVLLATTPTTSGISKELAAVDQSAQYQVDPNYLPDYLGARTAFENYQQKLAPFLESAKHRTAPQDYANRAAPSANTASVLVIGDSVTLGAKQAIESIIPNSFVDAKESRGVETAVGILAGYAATGPLPEIIVISLGTNQRTFTHQLLQTIVDAAGGNHKFIIMTAYAGPNQPRETQNSVMKSFADAHENVFLCDWWEIAHDNWSLMYADHIHLNPEGRVTYANLLSNTIRGIAR